MSLFTRKALSEIWIGNHCVGVSHACYIVGFAWGQEGDGSFCEFFRQVESSEMGRKVLVENEVTVNLVGYHDKVVALAEFGKLEDFSF